MNLLELTELLSENTNITDRSLDVKRSRNKNLKNVEKYLELSLIKAYRELLKKVENDEKA